LNTSQYLVIRSLKCPHPRATSPVTIISTAYPINKNIHGQPIPSEPSKALVSKSEILVLAEILSRAGAAAIFAAEEFFTGKFGNCVRGCRA
jgi:hypothetical protein